MTFLALVGGLVIFGLLCAFFPRASFAWVLALYLVNYHGLDLFGSDMNLWGLISTLLFIVAIVFGFLYDLGKINK